MQTGSALRRRGIGTALVMDGLSVLPRFGAAHITGNFLRRLRKAAVPVMDVAAGLALHGFYVAADFIAVFGVVWAKAPAVRLQRKGRKRQQTQHKNAGQENSQYSFHKSYPPFRALPGCWQHSFRSVVEGEKKTTTEFSFCCGHAVLRHYILPKLYIPRAKKSSANRYLGMTSRRDKYNFLPRQLCYANLRKWGCHFLQKQGIIKAIQFAGIPRPQQNENYVVRIRPSRSTCRAWTRPLSAV